MEVAEGRKGGWWCPLPAPEGGEEVDHTKNCNHMPFSKIEHVRAHYHREHWDYGDLPGVPRTLRMFGYSKLVCMRRCGFRASSLEDMDSHTNAEVLCGTYMLHQVTHVEVFLLDLRCIAPAGLRSDPPSVLVDSGQKTNRDAQAARWGWGWGGGGVEGRELVTLSE